ncbi:hypothetical protein ALC62_05392 [Cyphomyrmex costatus]|uniref:Uncharacterized protein n=1 Tax=Cyphomyrmex costatus TaxID=456900 RepID=A0A195CSN0_9HYME|nr:hypothetical protein ALC62_05392 [Cyphomyrmex costatus]
MKDAISLMKEEKWRYANVAVCKATLARYRLISWRASRLLHLGQCWKRFNGNPGINNFARYSVGTFASSSVIPIFNATTFICASYRQPYRATIESDVETTPREESKLPRLTKQPSREGVRATILSPCVLYRARTGEMILREGVFHEEIAISHGIAISLLLDLLTRHGIENLA